MTTTLILKHLVIVLLQQVEKQDRTAVIAHSFRLSHSCTVR